MQLNDLIPQLPYGAGFRFVDRYELRAVERSVRTWKQYCENDPIVEAHFKGGPCVVPGVILIEQVCQSALLLGIGIGEVDLQHLPSLGEVKASFRHIANAPCLLRAQVAIDAVLSNAFGFSGIIFNMETEVCRVKGFCLNASRNMEEL